MPRKIQKTSLASMSAGALEEHITHIAALSIRDLRATWENVFATRPPPSFSKDLLARAITYRLQEQAYGGLKTKTNRRLETIGKAQKLQPRRVKTGSVLVREYKDVLHEVVVMPNGYLWQGKPHASLSAIAKHITGVQWNGVRFFGLKSKATAADRHQDKDHARLGFDGSGLDETDFDGTDLEARGLNEACRDEIPLDEAHPHDGQAPRPAPTFKPDGIVVPLTAGDQPS